MPVPYSAPPSIIYRRPCSRKLGKVKFFKPIVQQSVIVQPGSSCVGNLGKKYRNRKHSPLSRSPSPAVSVITISSESDEDKNAARLKNRSVARQGQPGQSGSQQAPAGSTHPIDLAQQSPLVPPGRVNPTSVGQSPSQVFLPLNENVPSSNRNAQNNRDTDVSIFYYFHYFNC